MLVLPFGTHIFLTIRLGFIQKYLGRAIRLSFQQEVEDTRCEPFRSPDPCAGCHHRHRQHRRRSYRRPVLRRRRQGLMAVPNLISLILLSKVIIKETKDYLWAGDLDREVKW